MTMAGVLAGLAIDLKKGFLDSPPSAMEVFTAAAGGDATGGCSEGVGGAGAAAAVGGSGEGTASRESSWL